MAKVAQLEKPFRNRIVGAGMMDTDQFLAAPGNWRLHPDHQQQALAGAIDQVGFIRSILVNKLSGTVIDGHLRVTLALRSGVKSLPVEYVELTDEEERLALLTLDPIASMAAADKDKLAELLHSVQADDERVTAMLADLAAQEGLAYGDEPKDAEPQFDRAAELLEKWGVEYGSLWKIANHRLLCGDSTVRADVERVMGGEKAFVFSDPPYGIDIVSTDETKFSTESDGPFGFIGADGWVPVNAYAPIIGDDTTSTAKRFYSLCVDMGTKDFILWGGNYFAAFLPPSPCWLIWDKRENIPSNNFADCEIAWTSFDKPARIYRHLWSGLLRKGNRKDELIGRVHPAQKPVGLAMNIMRDFPADIYLDGFLGSGSFLVAVHNIGKRMIGIEKSADYVALCLERMATAFPGIQIERMA